MSWLAILQLSTNLLQQALAAFSTGKLKESHAEVVLQDHHLETVKQLAKQ